MRIGELKHRVDIQAETKTPDGMGGTTVVWTTLKSSVAAAIWPISAKEQIQAMATTMTITHRIRIRYRSVMRSSWRIKHGNKYYNIVSIINPNMDRKWLDVLVEEAA